jgi:hypothetical protein
MVLYKGYCRPLGKKVDFTVKDVISMNTKRGIKWRVKGTYDNYNISTFCSKLVAEDLLNKLPLTMDAEIAYTPAAPTYESEELLPLFSNATKKADEIEAEEETIEVQEQIQENTNAQELDLHSEKLPAKYYKKNGSLDMRYSICREYAAKRAESQNAVELEASPSNYNANSSVDVLRAAMKKRKQNLAALYEELEQRDMDLKDKQDSDIATYGKVLGNSKLMNKIEATERKILKQIDSIGKLQAKIDAKFKLSYRDNKVLKEIRSNDPTANTTSENTYRFDHRYSGSARQRRLLKRKAEESFETESFEAEKEPVFGDWEDGVVMFADGSLYVKVVGFPTPFSNDPRLVGESMWVIVKKGNEYEGKGYLANKPIYSSLKVGTLIDYGYGTNIQKPMFKGSDKTDIITKEQMIDPNFKGILRTTPDKYFENEMQLFGDEDEEILKEFNEMGLLYSIDDKLWNKKMKGFDAESFEAAYTPEQTLDDYTPEQLTTSSAVTGDFFEDSLKYSYGGTQAAEEIPQEETEIVYAEGFPALQNAEAGMVVENIENYYKDKEDKFMTLVVDEATLFRLASDLPIFVELTPSKYAGYTNLRFNYVENPDLEQKILSYAISLPSNMEQQEEPEYLAGDVRNRLFDVEFDDWAEQEMKTHGDEVSFKDWADEESKSHGDEEFMDWAKHEEESHDERYEAEGGRNVSDFEMGNTDRYEIGDEIIALSSALKRAGDWDWKNVKKIGKGIKQGKYERIQKHMADIDYKTRRVLWDKHHNDFYNLFNDEQMRGLAIPWVTDKYKAESFEAEKIDTFSEIENEWKDSPVIIYDEADDKFYGVKEILVQEGDDVLEDGQPYLVLNKDSGDLDSPVIYRDFQTGYDAESFEALDDSSLCVICKENEATEGRYETIVCEDCAYGTASNPGWSNWRRTNHEDRCPSCNNEEELWVGDWMRCSKCNDSFCENCETDGQTLCEQCFENKDAESFEAKQEVKPRKLCVKCSKQRLTPQASNKGITVCATCQRRFGLKSKQAEFFEAQPVNVSDDMIIDYLKNSHKVIRKYTAPYRFTKNGIAREFKVKETWMANKLRELEKKGLIDSSVMRRTEDSPDGSYSLRKPVKIYKLAGTELNKDLMRADEEYKFVIRIPKSMGIGEKTEILRNNLEYVIKKANRPLYPREVVELYNRERGSGKQSRFKKGGLSTGKISRLINSEPQKYYVSRSGLIHYVGESSMQDYIKNLDPKYFAEDEKSKIPSDDIIIKYLENSHRFIRKYNAPFKYSSKGMAEKFGVSQSAMRAKIGGMEQAGKVKSTPRRCEDAPKQHMERRLKIYYLPDKRLMN